MEGIEDLEGSEGSDVLIGDEGGNQILGHKGEDTYRALGGDDAIFANSGTRDRVIDCGEGDDSAVLDLAAVGDPAPLGCERGPRREGKRIPARNRTAAAGAPHGPAGGDADARARGDAEAEARSHAAADEAAAPAARAGPGGAAPPRAAVVFRFGASESSRFECKLDAKPYRSCRSPLRTHLAIGRHTLRVFAIDSAGNRDKTPALARVRVVARHR